MSGVVTVTHSPPHVPVLLGRVVELLAQAPTGPVLDATVGAGGHAAAILEERLARHGQASLIGLDRDPDALAAARARLAELRDRPSVQIELVRARFDQLDRVLEELDVPAVVGVLLDLGMSSMQVDRAERGFSYRQQGPLDMRMDPDLPVSAADLVNEGDPGELVRILRSYGEERFARRIVDRVVDARPITTTTRLAEVVRDAVPQAARRSGGHPATRTFQALRIAVNGELEALESALPAAIDHLAEGGICVAIAYHSLEDRIVKQAFTRATTGCICPPDLPVCGCGRVATVEYLVRRPERPSPDEVEDNPRASAARLRAVRRTSRQDGR